MPEALEKNEYTESIGIYIDLCEKSMFGFKCTTIGDFTLTPSGLSEDILTVIACNHRLSMAEHNADLIAATTSYIHEIRVRSRNQTF